jgi:hypothetical protein
MSRGPGGNEVVTREVGDAGDLPFKVGVGPHDAQLALAATQDSGCTGRNSFIRSQPQTRRCRYGCCPLPIAMRPAVNAFATSPATPRPSTSPSCRTRPEPKLVAILWRQRKFPWQVIIKAQALAATAGSSSGEHRG